MTYFWLFLSGLLAFNSLPHFIHGISGERFFLPSRHRERRFSPLANVLWGFANLLLATIIWDVIFQWPEKLALKMLAILAGGLVVATVLSLSFAKRAKAAEKDLAEINSRKEKTDGRK